MVSNSSSTIRGGSSIGCISSSWSSSCRFTFWRLSWLYCDWICWRTVSRRLSSVFHAEPHRELVVDRRRLASGDRLDVDVERRRLAGEVLDAVVVGKSHVDRLLVPRRQPDQLLLEARNELVVADRHRGVVVGAAVERLAIDLADIGDGQTITGLGRAFLGREGSRIAGERLAAGPRRPRRRPRPPAAPPQIVLKSAELDLWQHLVDHRVREVGAAGEHLVRHVLVFGQPIVRCRSGLLAALAQRLAGDLGEDRLAGSRPSPSVRTSGADASSAPCRDGTP